MKKLLTITLTLLLALSLTGAAFAHGHGAGARLRDGSCGGTYSSVCGQGRYCLDQDGDGLCDQCGRSYPCQTGCGQGLAYVDADGDGLCDNAGTYSHHLYGGRHCGR